VGKSTLLGAITTTKSEVAAYEFTTLTCIPGMISFSNSHSSIFYFFLGIIHYNDAKIQLLDLPGIIEGAADGKGRGRQVIAVAKGCDLVLMILDALKADEQKKKLTKELEKVGLRLNRNPPNIKVTILKTGGVKVNSTCKLTQVLFLFLWKWFLIEFFSFFFKD